MKYKFYLSCNYGFTNLEKRLLYEAFHNFEEIFSLTKEDFLRLPFMKEKNVKAALDFRERFDLEKEYEDFANKKMGLSCYFDDDYPKNLKLIHNAPFQLFYFGKLPRKEERIISVVGARRCSGYGREMTLRFSEELSKCGFSIVSGMAEGIDGYAHEGAIKGKTDTYAILGCGVDICYPPKHHILYEEIKKHGGVISEYGPKIPPRPDFFPNRNRIISGLCDVLLVMEAKEKSGSLITASLALEQGKDIFALPGRISDPLSNGTNKIISEGAGIICSISQLISDMNELKDWDYQPMDCVYRKKLKLEKEDLMVYSCFDFNSKSIDEIVDETKLDLMTVLRSVLHLSDLGLIEESFLNQYIKV